MASVSGFQILRFAQLWLVHELSESPLALGYVGMANAVPAISLNLFGGVLADKFDKRKLIMTAQTIASILVFVLATLTLVGAVEGSADEVGDCACLGAAQGHEAPGHSKQTHDPPAHVVGNQHLQRTHD